MRGRIRKGESAPVLLFGEAMRDTRIALPSKPVVEEPETCSFCETFERFHTSHSELEEALRNYVDDAIREYASPSRPRFRSP